MSDFSRMMEMAMAANATKTNEALGVVPVEAPKSTSASSHPAPSSSSSPPPKK